MSADRHSLRRIRLSHACSCASPPMGHRELHIPCEVLMCRHIRRCEYRLRTALPGSFLVNVPLDLHPALADSAGFVPMYFGFGNRTILKSHRCDTLQFSPTSRAKVLLEIYEIADSVTNGDRSDVADLTDDFERFLRHVRNLSRFTLRDKTRLCSHLSASVRALRRCENGAVLQYNELARADRDVHVAHVTVGVQTLRNSSIPSLDSRDNRGRSCRNGGSVDSTVALRSRNTPRRSIIRRDVDSMVTLGSRNTPGVESSRGSDDSTLATVKSSLIVDESEKRA